MNFEQPLFLIPFLVGTIFILAGFVTLKFPPRKINGLYGYRTSSSMKSQERWDFAQKYSSREMIKYGVILILASTLGVVPIYELVGLAIALGLIIGVVIILFLKTEKAINSKFQNK